MATLKRLLDENPQLIRARSTREHQATLLHYVSANGVEGYRQKTPNNAAKVAEILLQAGAEVDAEAQVYDGGATTLGLAATSIHPEQAGVQDRLMEILLEHGAAIDHRIGAGNQQPDDYRGTARSNAVYVQSNGLLVEGMFPTSTIRQPFGMCDSFERAAIVPHTRCSECHATLDGPSLLR